MDFQDDLYGEEIRVEFIRFLRDVKPFASGSALVEQLRADVDDARAALEEEGPFGAGVEGRTEF
jgi:riboflavin kinase/FMN adenylyltransferase